MNNGFIKINHFMNDNVIKAISVMKNTVWILKDADDNFKETEINVTDEEVHLMIKIISEDVNRTVNERNPMLRAFSPNWFITDIIVSPVALDKPIVTMYREELFSYDY